MIHRIQRGKVPPKPHTVFKPDGEKLAFEHCFTRQGFEGSFTVMYHENPPHWIDSQEDLGTHPGLAELSWDGAMRRRHFVSNELTEGGSPFMARKLMVGNPQIRMWVSRPDESDPTLCANADADELTFIFEGTGRLETPLGVVPFREGDYVYVPRGMSHRFVLDGKGYHFVMEAKTYIDVPRQWRARSGQLLMDAPYTHRDFVEPGWPDGGPKTLNAPRMLRTLRNDTITEQKITHDPFDVIGWDGFCWPFAFNVANYQPKTGLVHLPPTTHITFAGDGFVICSFVPRKTDFHENAIPCPYPHSSPSCDEVLFYVSGNFTSRKGVGPGSISLHPTGVPHGPHPGMYEKSIGTDRTNELAVMVDTFQPLHPTDHARGVEDDGYQQSWVR